MEQLFEIYMRVKKYLYFFLSFCAFAWALTPYQSVFLGLFVGTSASVFNLTLLVRRAKVFDKAIEDEGKVYGLGTISRMATAVINPITTLIK